MATYSEEVDLLTGDIPIPSYLSAAKILQDAADEIDSQLGFIYETPIDMTDTGPVSRPARLLLKRISVHLSSGRLIMAADAGGENVQVQAYGRYLIKEAQDAIKMIASGAIVLDGATKAPVDSSEATAPLISNLDAESNVEAFYDRLTNPSYTFPGGQQVRF